MGRSGRYSVFTVLAVALALVAACSQEPLAPAGEALVPSLAKALPKQRCDFLSPFVWIEYTNYPVGGAALSLTPLARLRIRNAAMASQFGVCTQLFGSDAVAIEVAGAGIGVPAIKGSMVTINFRDRKGIAGTIRVRRMPGGGLRGFMDYGDDVCVNELVVTRNGEEIQRIAGQGKLQVPLPTNFHILGWATFPSSLRLSGRDMALNQYVITAQASQPTSCHENAHLFGMVAVFDNLGPDAEVVYQSISF